ncbi:uncharacterized protein [Oscarella lobularis]|uniref:uncharacterized protein n=1 Tax=Oscarella lobularis TaxID=121494 RepID=UPI003313E00C
MAARPASSLLKAVVIGGTGATGKCLLGELITSPAFDEVVSIGRREATIPAERYDTSGVAHKLKQHIVDFDLDKYTVDSAKSLFEGKDVVFCCLGTTRGAARRQPGNSSENFRRVDLHLVIRSAEIAKAASVRHFSLVSSVGGNANSWFLYLKTKGEAEDGVEALGFDRASLWKPGLLQRAEEARFVEKFFGLFMTSLGVWDLAVAMRFEAEQFAYGRAEFPKCSRYNNREIRAFIAEAKEEKAAPKSDEKEPAQEGDVKKEETSNEAEAAVVKEGAESEEKEEAANESEGKDEEAAKGEESVNESGEKEEDAKDSGEKIDEEKHKEVPEAASGQDEEKEK